jgi:acyl carrier protein
MAGRTAQLDIPEGGQAPDAVLALTRQFLAELRPGAAWIRPVKLDSALERDLGLGSLSRVELAVRIERAFGVNLPEQTLGGAVTLRDLLTAPQKSPRRPSADAPAVCRNCGRTAEREYFQW